MNLDSITKLVINLPERVDRLEVFKKEMEFFNTTTPYTVIQGTKYKPSYKAIGETHIKAINYAKENVLNYVLIMEDDVKFIGDYTYLEKALNNLPENWDILLGGVYYIKDKIKPINDYWSKIGDFCGLHFYIVNSTAYSKFDNYKFKEHIDRWVGKNLNCFVINKPIAEQYNGFSDNVNKNVNYTLVR